MDLFEYAKSRTMENESPLASRLRPTKLEEVVGQQHIVGKDKLLYRAIKADKLTSVIFYGPPGTGKTTLAKVIANTTSADFTQINATVAGKKDMEEVVKQAQNALGMYGRKTILFIDEIHRFNKGQQDYLLPFVEDGTIILIGATTENPYFEVNGALLSRSIVFELKALEIPEIKELLLRAVNDKEKGMGSYNAVLDEDALEFLADMAGGDARSALNAIELGILTTPRASDGKIHITLDVASECIQKRVVRYDKNGDNHYDIISAFIKSMRGSDPDAAVYYLAKMLYAGEDVKFIARRIMILASEDIGNADPQALCVATAAAQAVERIGMPESQIILAQAVAYVAQQLRQMAAFVAEHTGRALSEEALRQALERSGRTLAHYRRYLEERAVRHVSDEMTSEMLSVFALHSMLGSPEAEEYARRLADQVAALPRAFRGKRLVWAHTLPHWQDALREILNFSDRVEIVACDMACDFWEAPDPAHPYESMARRLLGSCFNGGARRRVERVLELARRLHADGVVWFCHWGCKQTSGASQLARQTLEAAGFPTLVLDGDGCDAGNANDGQMVTRLQAFLEQLEGRA